MRNQALPSRLSREWSVLAHRPSSLERAARWSLGIEIRSLDDVTVAAGLRPAGVFDRSRCRDSEGDRVLACLLVAARTDDLAARVVLERLLPPLRNRAHRWARRAGVDWAGAFEELVSSAWVAIRTFPLDRCPQHLAARLLRDAEHAAFVKATRRTWVAEPSPAAAFERPQPVGDPEPVAELAQLVADAGLDDRQLRFVRLLLSGRLTADVAAELGVSERTVRYHRDGLVSRLRAVA